ncbi:MAG TPA: hypothetical protein DCM28_06545 [Phycisphaerales bacterium]|nr:hypothetical protein [Phycisphaerales bacterium]HCD34736.1 hypothetical protein [Phycisphaerales bacterium]|tara:strand:- start:6148 stop:7284 length:1137 start_codon:yes stop_codon:yes gene_type:complete
MASHFSTNTLDLADERPLYKQIEERLEQYILQNDLSEGSLIPSLRILANQFSTNELTVRRAVRGLVEREILVTRQGRGTFVNLDATRRKVLWVCGVGVEDGEVSPFYQLVLRRCHKFCEALGFKLQPVWLGSHDRAGTRSFCNRKKIGEYAGYVFVGCHSNHPVLEFVREANLKHVMFSHEQDTKHRCVVSSDYSSAVELGLEHFKAHQISDITIVELKDVANLTRKVAMTYPMNIDLVSLPEQSRLIEFEQAGYLLAKQLIQENSLSKGVFILDDIIAKGMTRAILEVSQPGKVEHHLIVLSALQTITPAGLPVTYVVNDADEMVREAMRILADEIEGQANSDGCYVSPYYIQKQVSDTHGMKIHFEIEKLLSSSKR